MVRAVVDNGLAVVLGHLVPGGTGFATLLGPEVSGAAHGARAGLPGRARRILAFALMIRGGIPAGEAEPYLHARAWLTDAARLLDVTPEALAAELVTTMLAGGAIVLRDGRLHAAAEHTPVPADSPRVPYPRAWPAPEPR